MKNLGDVGAGHVLGRYELLMPIATGGMATVWAARLKGTRGFQKIVAIKTILPQLSEDPQFEQMFLDEASLASRIRHPNVAQILDLGEEAGVLFLVMDWVDGEPLSALLKAASRDAGSIPLPITIRIISQACAGLHAAHELRDESGAHLGLVHRDASPQNILVTFDGVVKVVDFGIAKATGRGSADTNAGQIKGKAAYMSPEQVKGDELDRRTDVFALGTILYLMTTGRHPFRGQNDVTTLYNISAATPVMLPSKLNRRFPLSLEAVVMKALAKDADERFASAHEMQRALDMALPASQRLTTDAEVASFMHHLLGERQEQRKNALKMALRLADERALGRIQPGTPDISQPGFTPPSAISGLMPPNELRSSFPKRADGEGSPSAAPSVGAMTTPTGLLKKGRLSTGGRIALIGAVVGIAAGAALLVASQWPSQVASSIGSSAPAAAMSTANEVRLGDTKPPAGAAHPHEGAVQHVEELEPEKTVDAHADAAVAKSPPRVFVPPHPVIKPVPTVATPSASTKPTPTATAFVPPLRNPGF